MRILAVGPMPPKIDGLADYTEGVVSAYMRSGHEVSVIADAPAPLTNPQVVGEVSFYPRAFACSVWKVLSHPVALVHVQHTVATYALRLIPLWTLVVLARLRGAKVLVTHHEVTRDIGRLGLAGRAYYRLVSHIAHVVHVHTSDAHDTMTNDLGVSAERVRTHAYPVFPLVPGSVTGNQLRERHRLTSQLIVLQLGFIQVEKGVAELIEGFGVLSVRRPDLPIRVVVAGNVRRRPPGFKQFEAADDAYLARVRQRVVELDLVDRVTFTGHVPADEMSGWLEAADLVTLPYVAIEQSSIANLAVAADVPVIATRVGGLAEVFADLPGFQDLSPAAVADALEAAADNLAGISGRARRSYARIREQGDPAGLIKTVIPYAIEKASHV